MARDHMLHGVRSMVVVSLMNLVKTRLFLSRGRVQRVRGLRSGRGGAAEATLIDSEYLSCLIGHLVHLDPGFCRHRNWRWLTTDPVKDPVYRKLAGLLRFLGMLLALQQCLLQKDRRPTLFALMVSLQERRSARCVVKLLQVC